MLGPEEQDDRIAVNAIALCTSEEQVARVSEAFGRVCTGMPLEGINLTMNFIKMEPEENP